MTSGGSALGSPKVSTEDTGRKAASEFLEAVECGGCVDKYIQVKYVILLQAWEPSDAKVTHSYSRRLPVLGRKLRF